MKPLGRWIRVFPDSSKATWVLARRRDGYILEAEKYIKECDQHLEDCDMILDSLEGRFEITPKPSELLGW